MVFDVDHDFEGPRAPKAHLDTVKYKPVTSPGTPYPPHGHAYLLLRHRLEAVGGRRGDPFTPGSSLV